MTKKIFNENNNPESKQKSAVSLNTLPLHATLAHGAVELQFRLHLTLTLGWRYWLAYTQPISFPGKVT
jgi:hypothetical protein